MVRKHRQRAAKMVSNAAAPILSAGKVFDDGRIVELVRRNSELQLLAWDGATATIGRTVQCGSDVYAPSSFDQTIVSRITFPGEPKSYGTAPNLLHGISDELRRYLNICEETARLLAYFPVSTWFPEAMSIAPCVSIATPTGTESLAVLKLLRCFCRHPLLLGEVSPKGLRSLPSELQVTLLLNEPSLAPKIQNLLNFSSYRGMSLTENGKIIDLYFAKAIAGRRHSRLLENVIELSISPRHAAQLSLLNDNTLKELEDEYQPKLLMYRLKSFSSVFSSTADEMVGLTLPLLEVARNVGLCFADKELRTELNNLLKDQDEEVRGERLVEHPSVVLEALLVLCHEPNRQSVTVEEITELVNALLTGRGETNALSWRGVGAQLKSLQIFTRRFSGGKNRGIDFDLNNRRKIHKLAADYEVPLPLIGKGAQCQQCPQA